MASDDRRTDQEHYIRLIQAEVDRHLDEKILSRPALRGDDPEDIEARLSGRALELADRLGKALSELFAWLDQTANRRRVLTPQNRGKDRRSAREPMRHP